MPPNGRSLGGVGMPYGSSISATNSGIMNGNPALPGNGGSSVQRVTGGSGPVIEGSGATGGSDGGDFSAYPVRYADGVVEIDSTDLSSGGFGMPWGQTRSWTNGPGYASASDNGNGWVDTQLPTLLSSNSGTVITLVSNGIQSRSFAQNSDGSYTDTTFDQEQLTYNSTLDEYTLVDTLGDMLVFAGFGSGWQTAEQGQFLSFTDPNGNVTQVTSTTSDGRVAEIQQSGSSGGHTETQSFLYAYVASGVNAGLLQSITLRQKVDSGSWTTVRSVHYTYYDGTQDYGNAGDLMTAVVEDANSDTISTDYYRYYTDDFSGGYVGGLEYVFTGDSYNRLVAAVGDPTSADDSAVAPYADNYFQYDDQQRVTEEVAQQAGCSACSGGLGTFTYSYTNNGNGYFDYNSWTTQTVETLPDGNENIVYTNGFGQPILTVNEDTTTDQQWLTYNQYDDQGRLILAASPSAVSGYNDSYADLVIDGSGNDQYLNTSSGLITLYNYAATTTATSSTAGDVAGYLQSVQIEQGYDGTPITQESWQYLAHTAGSVTIYPQASDTVYRNTDGTGAETTSYSYAWFSGTNMEQSVTTTLPTISSAQNGPGTAASETTVFDSYGRPIWTKDAGGFITYTAYDAFSGAVVTSIADVNTADSSEFTGLPSGWSTPTGGGLNLVTSYTVDALGRITKETDPNGNVTYTVYNDANHEVRVYPGFQSGTGLTTGPTQIYRDDLSGGYTEVLTMSATPHLTGGVPDGTEAVSGVQTLSRQYTNDAGQLVEEDDYFNLSGVTYSTSFHIGTAGVNYYETQYSYDDHGLMNRIVSPTGTITRMVYDLLDRLVSVWVGTDDTPASGYWSPDNNTSPSNMVQVTGAVYDNGSVGDNDLTALIHYPGGSAPAQETDIYYDWRDRPVAAKQGVQSTEDSTTGRPIVYTTYDNLNEAVEQQTYDGDGVTLTYTDGVPDAPDASLLRAQTETSYDDQGQIYRQQVSSVDPSTGDVSSTALTTNYYYDLRGNLIAASAPGGLWTKQSYDGADRPLITFLTDGAGGTTWAEAASVSSDTVLEQQENVYDADGNVIETLDRQRFDSATGSGALGSPSSGIGARVYYEGEYYDAANRPVADVNVGTNAGTTWTRPSTVPTASSTVLVTSYGYNAAGWQSSMTDPAGNVTHTAYDNLGRVTQTIAAYTDGTPTNSTNQTTDYTYDGDNHVLTITAVLPSSAEQETAYVYGVTTASGSTINSNDMLAGTEYPNPSTGVASSSNEETYTRNALGQLLTYTDRNGTTHTYSYDVLGRQTSDAITTLDSGVDGSVRRIDTAYNSQGLPYLFTSYDAASGGDIVNQVKDVYNGLGQLTGEYQAHSGAVNTSSTPEVQYVYTEMASGVNNSRLTEMMYPNGRILHFGYNSGLDSSISRLSFIADDNGSGGVGTHLEDYTYLGLNTVVTRSYAQPGIELTYLKQGSESNGDAGDQYTGLDRFGRVVDQRWILAGMGEGAVSRMQSGYDADSNRLYDANLIDAAFSDLYTYNDENELTSYAQGTLNSTNNGIVGTPSDSQSWSLDALGNFTSVTTNGTPVSESTNADNELTGVGSATLTFDNNGNTTTDANGNQYIYDAWSRLVQAKSGSTTLATYTYDAMGRRIIQNDGTATDLYYSAAWQVIEERVSGSTQAQYVWSPTGIDTLVLRDSNPSGGVLTQRLYAVQDVNGNVIALVDTSGNVLERYVYEPYGQATILNGNWSTRSTSSFAWIYLFQGGRADTNVELYDFRNRIYSPTLMRWLKQDPLRFAAGDGNSSRFVGDNPAGYDDPSGLERASFLPSGPRGWYNNLPNAPWCRTYKGGRVFSGQRPSFGWAFWVPHAYVAILNPDGTISTYSKFGDWQVNDAMDRSAFYFSYLMGIGTPWFYPVPVEEDVSGEFIRAIIRQDQTNPSGSYNVLTNNCQVEAASLLNRAKQLEQGQFNPPPPRLPPPQPWGYPPHRGQWNRQ